MAERSKEPEWDAEWTEEVEREGVLRKTGVDWGRDAEDELRKFIMRGERSRGLTERISFVGFVSLE